MVKESEMVGSREGTSIWRAGLTAWRERQSNLLRPGMATFEQDLHYGATIA